MLSEILKKYEPIFYPLLGIAFQKEDFCKINLSVEHPELDLGKIQTYNGLEEYIQNELEKNKAKVGVGGYLEKRVLYQQSANFKNPKENRDIHLGIDLWSNAGTKIFSPLDATVHSFKYNAGNLDYGATIILQHELDGLVFYTLFGHLTLNSLSDLAEGKVIKKGTAFTAMGMRNENGGWVPHLHFQLVKNLQGKRGDFPGVASENNLLEFSKNCPDPNVFIKFDA